MAAPPPAPVPATAGQDPGCGSPECGRPNSCFKSTPPNCRKICILRDPGGDILRTQLDLREVAMGKFTEWVSESFIWGVGVTRPKPGSERFAARYITGLLLGAI